MRTTNHYRAFPLPIGTLSAVGKTADLVARITVAVVFAETAFDSIGDFVSTEPIDTSGSLRCVFVAIQVAGAVLLVKPRRFGWIALPLLSLTIFTLLAQAISLPSSRFSDAAAFAFIGAMSWFCCLEICRFSWCRKLLNSRQHR
jgi:hypothetical protein